MPATPVKRIRVLFVCLGNICRSPMAEAIFLQQVAQAGLAGRILADSAGTGAWHIGEPPHHGTQRVLREQGIQYSHSARVVTREDFQRFDYIIAMDSDNLYSLSRMANSSTPRPRLLLEYAPEIGQRDVPDPYYTGRFAEVYQLIEAASRRLLAEIVRAERLDASAG